MPCELGQIVNVINLYALAVDCRLWELFDQVVTPDVKADYAGSPGWSDLPSFERDFAAFHEPLQATEHVMANHPVRVDEDGRGGAGLTYGQQFRSIRTVPEGGGEVWQGAAWNDDRLVVGRMDGVSAIGSRGSDGAAVHLSARQCWARRWSSLA